MQKGLFYTLFFLTNTLTAHQPLFPSEKFAAYHLNAAMEEIEDEEIFNLIQENVENLKNRDASDDSANELINLIAEGYTIDPFNMSKLIETLTHRDASDNATRVMIQAIEHESSITLDHKTCLIQTLAHADASDNATEVILKIIEQGIKFGPKERRLLAEVSRVMNAKGNVEKIRRALHEQRTSS